MAGGPESRFEKAPDKQNENQVHDALLNSVREATVGKGGAGAENSAINSIKQMSTADIHALPGDEIAKFTPKMVAALEPNQIKEMSPQQIGAFNDAQRAAMSPEQNKAALGVMVNSIHAKLSQLGDAGHDVLNDAGNTTILNYVMDAKKMDPESALRK